MEVTRAEIDAIYDAAGRLVVSPNALNCEGQSNVPADLRPGESLAAFLARHVPGIESGAWTVMIGGAVVPQAMWARTYPKHGQLIACRAVLRRAALQLVAVAALSYFTLGAGGIGGGSFLGLSGMAGGMAAMGAFMAGSMLINKVLAPKIPAPQTQAQKQVYSLTSQRNSARAYEPLPVLWGEMRVTPDLASQPYAWFEGDDQYLSTILLGGINVHEAFDLAIGDTPIANYSDVSLFFNGFPGMASQSVPLYSNVDAIPGGEFVNGGDWITRTGSAGAAALQVDIEGQLYDVDGDGGMSSNSVSLTIEHRAVGAVDWAPLLATTLVNASADVLRRTYTFNVAPGQYEVRAKLGIPRWNDGGGGDACKFSWTTLKSVQADTTDYSQWGRIGIKIRASGQLSGGLDTVRATYRARPMPVWNGVAWVTATTRANGLSNPGAILLQTLRGVRDGAGRLQFGFGMSDEQIDIEGLKAFMLHCTAHGYTYDKWVTGSTSLGAFCQEVALAGMGEFAWTDGSRPTAVFVGNGQPISAVVNMANMLKGGFSVDYALSNAADGIEYQWLNRDTWEMTTLRVTAPGVATMLNPARITGEGVTSEAHAAVLARYHLAQSLYQYKTINYSADIEHLDYRRLSVLSVSHDLTQWGYGGRLIAAQRVGAEIHLTLDEPVPPLATPYIGLRVPGEREYRVWPVQPLAAESDTVVLVGAWPAGVPLPGEDLGNPAHDTLWCYDFKATPGYRVRVTSLEPEGDLKGAKVTCVPEGPEFWDYVLNGNYVPAPNQSSIPQLGRPTAKNLRVSERVNLQGDTEWYELECLWDVEGDYDHAQVWAGRDGSELRLVDGSAQASRSTFRIDGAGEWLIEVRPFNAGGQAGQAAVLLYITTMTQLPPRNPGAFVVQQIPGGLRRFAWMWAGDKPAALAGVQIRYLPGDVPLSVAGWSAMQPLGEASDIYTAQLETTKPGAGLWTFGLRAIDTAGQLANGVVRVVATLDQSFDKIQSPDLTPPPTPTGFAVSSALSTALLQTDAPNYADGHGHDVTVFYAAEVTAALPNPAFADARIALEQPGNIGSTAVTLGKTYRWWAKWKSKDGVVSQNPTAPIDTTIGKIGNTDLGPLIVEAGNLADNSVSASKIAAQAIDSTKFANGIEPVTIVSGGSLPTVKTTSNITFQGQLYTWDAATGKYEKPAFDGSIGGANLLKNAALIPNEFGNAPGWDIYNNGATASPVWAMHPGRYTNRRWVQVINKTLGAATLGIYQDPTPYLQTFRAGQKYVLSFRAKSPTPNLVAVGLGWNFAPSSETWLTPKTLSATEALYKVELVFAADTTAQLYITAWPSASMQVDAEVWITEPQLEEGDVATAWAPNPADILPGSITSVEIADNSITAPKLIAEAVTAGKIAANAISAYNLQANAVTAGKIAADAVTAGTIAAGAVNAREIAAGAVTAGKLTVANIGQTLNKDPYISDASVWAPFRLLNSAGKLGENTAYTEQLTDLPVLGGWFSISQNKSYKASAAIYLGQVLTSDSWFYLLFRDGAGNLLQAGLGQWGGWNVNHYWKNVPASSPRLQWLLYTEPFGAGTSFPIPNGAVSAAVGILANNGGIPGPLEIGYYKIEEKVDAELIVDGAITATKLAANSIAVGTAAIQNGAIVNAMIGNAAIDDAKIANVTASKLTTGTLAVGTVIYSQGWVWDQAGWAITHAGEGYFNNLRARGTVYATAGQIGSVNISGGGLASGGYSGYNWPAYGQGGFYLGPSGLLIGNANGGVGGYFQVTSNGEVYAPGLSIQGSNATFSGNLSAASGTFAGTITAQNVITTGNLQTNSATTAVSVSATNFSQNNTLWVNTEILGASLPAIDTAGTYVVMFSIEAGGSGATPVYPVFRIQVDGVDLFVRDIPAATGAMNPMFSFTVTFAGNGAGRYLRMTVDPQTGGTASGIFTWGMRALTTIVSKR